MKGIALDIGGTWVKSALVDLETGLISDVKRVPFPISHYGSKMDCHQDQIMSAVRGIMPQSGEAVNVFICSQMGGYRDNAAWVSWQDPRSSIADPEATPLGDIVYSALLASKFVPHPPIGDHQAALLGAGLQPRDLSINIGTGGQVSVLAQESDPVPLGVKKRKYFGDQCLHTVTHLLAGRHLAATATIWGCSPGDTLLELFHLSMALDYSEAAEKLSPKANFNDLVLTGGVMEQSESLRNETFDLCWQRPVRLVHDAALRGLGKYAVMRRHL